MYLCVFLEPCWYIVRLNWICLIAEHHSRIIDNLLDCNGFWFELNNMGVLEVETLFLFR